jgi:hypothetical protein
LPKFVALGFGPVAIGKTDCPKLIEEAMARNHLMSFLDEGMYSRIMELNTRCREARKLDRSMRKLARQTASARSPD